jgi:nucleoside-diphosphate-sugar epimerase
MDTILITGAAGFSGVPLVAALIEAGYAVVALLHSNDSLDSPRCAPRVREQQCVLANAGQESTHLYVHAGRLDDERFIAGLLRGYGVRKVIHLAGQSNVMLAEQDRMRTMETNVWLTYRFAHIVEQAARDLHSDIELLYLSTTRILTPNGDRSLKKIDEMKGVYDRSKYFAEKLLRSIDGLSITIIYCPGLFGAGNTHTLIAVWIKNALNRQAIRILGDGSQSVPLCSQKSLCTQILALVAQPWERGCKRSLVLAEDCALPLLAMARIICTSLDRIAPENLKIARDDARSGATELLDSHLNLICYHDPRPV